VDGHGSGCFLGEVFTELPVEVEGAVHCNVQTELRGSCGSCGCVSG
jgi:hypothetical protein